MVVPIGVPGSTRVISSFSSWVSMALPPPPENLADYTADRHASIGRRSRLTCPDRDPRRRLARRRGRRASGPSARGPRLGARPRVGVLLGPAAHRGSSRHGSTPRASATSSSTTAATTSWPAGGRHLAGAAFERSARASRTSARRSPSAAVRLPTDRPRRPFHRRQQGPALRGSRPRSAGGRAVLLGPVSDIAAEAKRHRRARAAIAA